MTPFHSLMSSISLSSAVLGILVQLAMVNVPGALTRPIGQGMAPTLRITSSLEPGRTYVGVLVGPFVKSQDLVIICSTDKTKTVSLSWWEGEKQLPSFASSEDGTVSSSFIVGTLQTKDSQRHFTCRELVSGAAKSVDLHLVDDHMEIQKDGISLEDEGKVDVFLGMDFNLNCVVNGTHPSTGLWWEGETKLPAKRSKSPNAIYNQLEMWPARIEDNGRKLTCRARNGQLTKTVILSVVEGGRSLDQRSPSHVLSTSGARPTTKLPVNASTPLPTTANEDKLYLIAGGVAIVAIAVVVVILIFVIVKMGKTITKQVSSTSQQQGDSLEHRSDTSRIKTSVPNSLMSLNPHELPTLSPLLRKPPPVEGDDETASSGGRMSSVMPEDRDHSYYYPDLINNSYYYPKITDDGKVALLDQSGQ